MARLESRGKNTGFGDNGGFTVIELLIAFTILAIVAGSLFQIFYVASHNNAKAAEYDTANNLAISAAELFQSAPDLSGDPMFFTEPGSATGRTWRSADGGRLIKYYDAGWQELEFFLLSDENILQPPQQTRYVLEAALARENIANAGAGDYLRGAVNVSLDAAENYRIVITENAGNYEMLFNGLPQEVDQQAIRRAISVNVAYTATGIIPKNIVVANKTSLPVNINVFDVPVGQAGDDDGYSAYIGVEPAEGDVGVMFFDEQERAAQNTEYFFDVTVREAAEDGAELARINTKKYVPG